MSVKGKAVTKAFPSGPRYDSHSCWDGSAF